MYFSKFAAKSLTKLPNKSLQNFIKRSLLRSQQI